MSFTPNGLLAPSPLLFVNSRDVLSAPSPISNDLWAGNATTLLSQPSEHLTVNGELCGAKATESGPFIENGLLSVDPLSASKTVHNTPNEDLFLPESQDDDLPDTSIFMGLGTERYTNGITGSKSSFPTHLPSVFIRATTFSGKSFHIKRKTRIQYPKTDSNVSGQRIGKLLDVPIHRLMEELSAATAASLSHPISQHGSCKAHVESAIEETLWVDKYRPERFMELVGNERVSRDAMAWVKQWDWCVFGKKKGKKRPRENDENYNTEDPYHRPQQRILLLSGPPGLGKTTLAHVIARQAGYEVMEINASDARSAQIVDDRIRPTLESGTSVGGTKPVLVVIDEIDGATGGGENSSGFIQKLVQLTYDKTTKKGGSKQKRDPKASRPILRPIICICNDANAAALAKLRPRAQQIRVTRPADIHAVKRLREICQIEGLRADTRALSTLVGVAKGDLRGCLNTLQFIKSKYDEVTENVVRAATAGMKEAETSITSVLNNLFAPMTQKRVNELGLNREAESKYVARLSGEVDGSGKEDAIALGCFAHYATLRRHDVNFSRYEKANEWLVAYDIFSSTMYSGGDFALISYLPYFLVPFYPLFQERGGQRVERDQTNWDNFQQTRCNEEIHRSLVHGVQTTKRRSEGDFRHLVSSPTFQLEFASYINRIISPPLRPVNSQVIKPGERALLSRLVDIMASLELRFVQERSEDGHLSYRLDPPIDVFVTYDGKRAADIAVSRYAVRHLVAGEIDALLITRQADAVEKCTTSKLEHLNRESKVKQDKALEILMKQSDKNKIDIADKPPTDFFGRPITTPSLSTIKAASRKNVEKKYRVTYHFTEGNSAAVRKPVKVATFL